jgi:hypothetical protein
MAEGNLPAKGGHVARQAAAPFELVEVQWSSRYGALGARLSSSKWSDRTGRSYLGFNGHREVVAWSHDGELSFFKLGSGCGLLRWASVQGEGWGSTKRLQRSFLTRWSGSAGGGATWRWR